MKKKIMIYSILLLVLTGLIYPQQEERRAKVIFNFGGGYSVLTGDGGEYWNPGFYLSATLRTPISSTISLGGLVSYHRWTPDETELTKDIDDIPGVDVDVSGIGRIIEIAPVIRYDMPKTGPIGFFFQVAGGMALIQLNALIEVSVLWLYESVRIEESENRPFISIGAGFSMGRPQQIQVEILALYHVNFTEDGTTKYFSAGLGLGF